MFVQSLQRGRPVVARGFPPPLSAVSTSPERHQTPSPSTAFDQQNPTAPAPPPSPPLPSLYASSPRASFPTTSPSPPPSARSPREASERARKGISHVAPRAEPQRRGAQQVGGAAHEHQRRQGPHGGAQDQPRPQGHHQDVKLPLPHLPFSRPRRRRSRLLARRALSPDDGC